MGVGRGAWGLGATDTRRCPHAQYARAGGHFLGARRACKFSCMIRLRSTVLAAGALLSACDRAFDYCENSLREYYGAPDGVHQAAVFDRSCGRSPSTTNLSVLKTGSSIPDEPGNAYSVEGAVVLGVAWDGPSRVAVVVPNGAKVVRQDTLVDGVTLRYRDRAAPDSAAAPGGTRRD